MDGMTQEAQVPQKNKKIKRIKRNNNKIKITDNKQ
jgi:hypothetical protein